MAKAKKQDKITHISKVIFEGYKSIYHLEIDLVKGLNIIIGPNGSGKSNFLGLLTSSLNWFPPFEINAPFEYYKSSQIEMNTLNGQKVEWYCERKGTLNHNSLKTENFFSISAGKESSYGRSKLVIGKTIIHDSDKFENSLFEIKKNGKTIKGPKDYLEILYEELKVSLPELIFVKYNLPKNENLISISQPGEIIFDKKTKFVRRPTPIIGAIEDSIMFGAMDSFYISVLKKKGIKRDKILNGFKFEDNDPVKHNLKKFSPIQDIRFSPNINIYEDENKASIENLILEFYVNGDWMPWSYLSDGTKRLFYLISEVSYIENAIILIEEPELGVHPDQFFQIMNFLKEEAENKQIIMSTHSPEALNIFNENELGNIILTKYDKKKGTTMSHLNKQQMSKAKAYMKELDLSDYWLQSDMEE